MMKLPKMVVGSRIEEIEILVFFQVFISHFLYENILQMPLRVMTVSSVCIATTEIYPSIYSFSILL